MGHDGWDNRLVVDSRGRPHMSAIDPEEFGGSGVEYYSQDDSGAWTVESVGSGSQTYKYATSIAVDPQGNPHITYFDRKEGRLALASRGSEGWNITTVDGDGEAGLFSSLAIGPDGRFHISYFLKESTTSGLVKYATKTPRDPEWEISQVEALDRLQFGFLGARNITSLALDREGNPWIAYSNEKELRLAVWNGSGWQIGTVVDAGARTLGQLVDLELDSNDHPHIAYFEVTDTRPLNGLIKYAKGTPN